LAQLSEQTVNEDSSQRKTKSDKKQQKTKQKNSLTDFDLIENAFNIPGEKTRQKKKSKKDVDEELDADPTMAISAGAITILENIDATTVYDTVSLSNFFFTLAPSDLIVSQLDHRR
jgi:hypothetical protein